MGGVSCRGLVPSSLCEWVAFWGLVIARSCSPYPPELVSSSFSHLTQKFPSLPHLPNSPPTLPRIPVSPTPLDCTLLPLAANITAHAHAMPPRRALWKSLPKKAARYRPTLPTIDELKVLEERPRAHIVGLYNNVLPLRHRQQTNQYFPQSIDQWSDAAKIVAHVNAMPPGTHQQQSTSRSSTTRPRQATCLPTIEELGEPQPELIHDRAEIIEFCRATASVVSPMLLPSNTACLWLYQLCGGYFGVLRVLLTLAAREAVFFFPVYSFYPQHCSN